MKKAFHWLLVHPIAFAWILAAIAIVLNWIVGSGAPPKKEHQAKAAQHETQAQQGSGHEPAAAPAAGHEQASTQAQAAAAMPAEAADAHQQAAATEPAQEANTASSSVAEQAAATAAEPVNAAVATAAAGAATAGTATVNENSSAEDLLLAAREAYWSGEYDQSVGFYQSLLKKENKPEHKGELANVYWKQGKSTEAVSLYAEIAPWLAEQGRTAELQSIKVYADVVDPTKAAEIGASIK
ncbi:MAG: hypothetical protein WBP46_14150 [Thiolinea sp.]